MRKQTKLAVGFTAAALLVIGASMTSFAAKGWVNEGGAWYYYDSNGDYVTDCWKSYNGNYFYLGDEGFMLTNQLIEDGDNYYYVDANGAMVKNIWVAIPADDTEELDVEYRWYFFGSTGKAYRNAAKKSINGKKYGFDEYGKMLFGFVTEDGAILNDEDDPVLSAAYYYGTNDDGAMHTSWLKYEDGFVSDQYDYDEEYWFFFDTSTGKKKFSTTKKVNGKTYAFDENGLMKWGWATESSTSGLRYFSASNDGHEQKKTWVYAIPSEEINASDYNNDTYRWFYVDGTGARTCGVTKKINSKWYAFDASGRMKTGLVYLDTNTVSGANFVGTVDTDVATGDDVMAGSAYLFYFSGSSSDGSMKTGSNYKIDLADDTYTFGFKKTTGLAYNGIESNKLYCNGILLTAGDDKYAVKTWNGGEYLVGSTGTRIKPKHYYKDANDVYWAVKSGDDATGYEIKSFTGEDAAKEAKAWLNS